MQPGALVAGKYRIVKQLGAGGMGSVWQAVHTVTERDFAIKFLHASCASSPSLLARFFQEAKVSGKLRHPSVIEIFDVGTEPGMGGAPYLVMELLDGASLDLMVRRIGPLPPRMVLESIADAARALELAHEKGIVHRDLKPENIFLHRPGTGAIVPKVLDFGISKIAGASGSGAGGPDVAYGLTQTGVVLGSPLYMSPEQAASDKTIDGRSDIHALGVVLWECLVGKPPFATDSYNNLVVQIMTGERPRLAEFTSSVPAGVAALVERAMARRREDRFQRASELADALEREIAVLPPSTSIASRSAASELFSRLPPRSLPPSVRAEPPRRDASTTAGVSLSSERQPLERSPAAFTLAGPHDASDAGRPIGETAYAATQPAIGPTLASADAKPELRAVPAVTPRVTGAPSRVPLYVGGALGAALLVGAALVLGALHASPAVAPAAASAAIVPGTALAAIPAEPAPSDSAAGAAPATAALSAPSSLPAAAPQAAHRASPGRAPAAPKRAASPKPKDDSVESSGF